ncbi:MAG: HD domain-containing phosphohydrolase [Actinomycetota bacterium]
MTGSSFRLSELLAALSLATDAGNGFPAEKTLRNTLLAAGIAAELQMDEPASADLYHASLLRFVGCTAFTYELARISGDEFAALQAFAPADETKPREAIHAVFAAGRGLGAVKRVRSVLENVAQGKAFGELVVRADCEASVRFARRFGMGPGMISILNDLYERWDGKGGPRKLSGDEIAIGSRILSVAHQAEIHHRVHGREAAKEMSRHRSGGWFDPACVDAFLRCADGLFDRIERGSVWDEALNVEPGPPASIGPAGLDDIAEGFADFADLKSPSLLGHSRGVAVLAEEAGRKSGLPDEEVATLRRAALLHDLGRVAVSSTVWEKPGSLNDAEWEQVRLHAYHTERVLSRSPTMANVASLAGAHHERLNGSGYHRGAAASALSDAARILAAADVYHALTEQRPHRPAMSADQALAEIDREVTARRLDRDAAAAVCAAAGQALRNHPPSWPAGLTDREVEILRLLARGRSKKEIAKELTIAPGTVHTHVTHIYGKIGSSTRAGAALFAVEHDLLR